MRFTHSCIHVPQRALSRIVLTAVESLCLRAYKWEKEAATIATKERSTADLSSPDNFFLAFWSYECMSFNFSAGLKQLCSLACLCSDPKCRNFLI